MIMINAIEAFLNQPFVLKLFEMLAGTATFGTIVISKFQPKDGMSKRELLKMIEEKDRQLERLTISNHAHKMRYEHMKKKHKGSTCN